MCTGDKEFTIRGVENCLARGYDRTGFFEVDTGEQKDWRVQLTDPKTPQQRLGDEVRRLRRVKIVATLGPASEDAPR